MSTKKRFQLRRSRAGSPHRRRPLKVETLEVRRLLVAEGDVFDLSANLSSAGLVGDLSASVLWGDGTETPLATTVGGDGSGPVRIRFDYSLDTGNFFGGANAWRRDLLQNAADSLVQRFTDQLAAITPMGKAQWIPRVFHPSSGSPDELAGTLVPVGGVNGEANLTIAANEILVFAGARDLPDNNRGVGGPGSLAFPAASNLTQQEIDQILAFRDTARGRDQAGALLNPQTDVAPWGGSIGFDDQTDWYFGRDPDAIGPGQVDFITIATHELAHVLGYGIIRSDVVSSWDRLTVSNTFTGSAATQAYQGDGNVPIQSDHWADSLLDDLGQVTLMARSLPRGTRTLPSQLDFAALDDLGWEVVDLQTQVTAQHRYADNGTYQPQIVLRGSESGERVQDASAVTVTNVTPTLTVVADQTVTVGQPLAITNLGTIVDPGFANDNDDPPSTESFTFQIDWGDTSTDQGAATIDVVGAPGESTEASFDAVHTYPSAGQYTVTVSVTDDDGGATQESFAVLVNASRQLSLSLSESRIREDAGPDATTLTVQRSGPPTGSDQVITLRTSDDSEATLADSVVIPADATSASIPVDAIDDRWLDGDVTVRLTASASGLGPAEIDLIVEDHEFLSATFSESEIAENDSSTLLLTVSRSNQDTSSELTVNVTGGNAAQLNMPDPIVISPGRQSRVVIVSPVNDSDPEPTLRFSFEFTSDGYDSAGASINLLDDEPPLFQNPADRFDVNGVNGPTAADALRVINELARRGGPSDLDPATEQPSGVFLDVNGDYRVTALDALQVINQIARLRNQSVTNGESLIGPIASLSDCDPWHSRRTRLAIATAEARTF